eukprot:244676_1
MNSILDQKLKDLMSNDRVFIYRPLWRNFNRNNWYLPSTISQFTESCRFPFRTGSRSIVLAKHVTFSNINDCLSSKNGKYNTEWIKKHYISKNIIQYPNMYSLSYLAECTKKSYYVSNHIKNFYNDKCLFDSLVFRVCFDYKTRKTINVSNKLKEMCNESLNEYPKDLKSKYYSLKQRFSNHLSYLTKHIKTIDNVSPIYSHKIQLRYNDEDSLKHVNHSSYFVWTEECLMYFDKDLTKSKKIFYSMSCIFWKQMTIKKWKTCYVNIWNKQYETDDNVGKCNYYGSIDICLGCCAQNENVQHHVHDWKHYTGFVATVIEPNMKSKL